MLVLVCELEIIFLCRTLLLFSAASRRGYGQVSVSVDWSEDDDVGGEHVLGLRGVRRDRIIPPIGRPKRVPKPPPPKLKRDPLRVLRRLGAEEVANPTSQNDCPIFWMSPLP